jgi:hypothetical protein
MQERGSRGFLNFHPLPESEQDDENRKSVHKKLVLRNELANCVVSFSEVGDSEELPNHFVTECATFTNLHCIRNLKEVGYVDDDEDAPETLTDSLEFFTNFGGVRNHV